MADPGTLSQASIGGSAAGAGLNFLGALSSGQSSSRMYQYQAGVARMNEQIALQNRDYALSTGETQAVKYGMGAAQRAGAIRAGQGASGIDVGSGTAVDVRASQDRTKNIDLNTIRTNAARVAYGFSTQAAQEEAKSNLYGMAAEDSMRAGEIKGLGSLIGGVTSVADKWLQQGQYGLRGGDGGNSFLNSQPLDI